MSKYMIIHFLAKSRHRIQNCNSYLLSLIDDCFPQRKLPNSLKFYFQEPLRPDCCTLCTGRRGRALQTTETRLDLGPGVTNGKRSTRRCSTNSQTGPGPPSRLLSSPLRKIYHREMRKTWAEMFRAMSSRIKTLSSRSRTLWRKIMKTRLSSLLMGRTRSSSENLIAVRINPNTPTEAIWIWKVLIPRKMSIALQPGVWNQCLLCKEKNNN